MITPWIWSVAQISVPGLQMTRILRSNPQRKGVWICGPNQNYRLWHVQQGVGIVDLGDRGRDTTITDLLFPGLAACEWFVLHTGAPPLIYIVAQGIDYGVPEKEESDNGKSVRVKVRRRRK